MVYSLHHSVHPLRLVCAGFQISPWIFPAQVIFMFSWFLSQEWKLHLAYRIQYCSAIWQQENERAKSASFKSSVCSFQHLLGIMPSCDGRNKVSEGWKEKKIRTRKRWVQKLKGTVHFRRNFCFVLFLIFISKLKQCYIVLSGRKKSTSQNYSL